MSSSWSLAKAFVGYPIKAGKDLYIDLPSHPALLHNRGAEGKRIRQQGCWANECVLDDLLRH